MAKEDSIYNEIWGQIQALIDYQRPLPLTDGPTINWDIAKGCNASVTLNGNRTLAVNFLTAGDYGTIVITQGGNFTITLPAGSKVSNAGGGAVILSADPGDIDILSFYYDGTNLFWNVSTDFT